MKYLSVTIILVFFISCEQQDTVVDYECKPGAHQCTPRGTPANVPTNISSEFIGEESTFTSGSNYQDFWTRYDQVNKLFGSTDCGEFIDSRKNSAMIGYRHIPETDFMEVIGYIHREDIRRSSGVNFYHSHLGLVKIKSKLLSVIKVVKNNYIFNLDNTNFLVMNRYCSSFDMIGRSIGSWFGGQRKPPIKFTIKRNKLSKGVVRNLIMNPSVKGFKSIRIATETGKCEHSNPESYLKNHSSKVYQDAVRNCSQAKISYLGCLRDHSEGISASSLKSYTYSIVCK